MVTVSEADDLGTDRTCRPGPARKTDDDSDLESENGIYLGVESGSVEFKESVVFPPDNDGRPNKEKQLRNVLRGVCAFLNSEIGGTLYLGVSDQGYVKGVQRDLDALKISSLDTYMRLYIQDPAKELSDEVTVKMTAEAIDISGIEYDRISSNMIGGDLPCYMYMTKDEKAGNPITMLYVGDSTDITETTFGNWAYGYFTADGPSSANSYVVNEDLLEKFMANEAVYTRIPLALLSGKPDESATSVQLTAQPMQISLLTAKKGLPDDNLVLNGLRQATYEAPKMERNERNYEGDKNPASAFGDAGPVIIILGILAIAGAVYAAYVIKRRKARPLAEKNNGDKEA